MSIRPTLLALSLLCAIPLSRATVPPKAALVAMKAQHDAAEQGDADAMAALGWRYFDGDGVQRNYELAAKWFAAGAARGNVLATYGLALCLLNGNGVSADKAEGNRLMRLAADNGNSDAQVHIGYDAEARGELDEARRWYALSADQRNPEGLRNLALLYRYGKGVPADQSKAYQLFLMSAERGQPAAMYYLADMLEEGAGATKDLTCARDWYRQSAMLGDPDARYELGRFTANGIGGERDIDEAARLFRLGADEGHAASAYALADAYFEGNGVPRDYAAARRWLAKGAELGHERSTIRLGRILLTGEDTKVDQVEAARLFEQAAASGSDEGRYWLGVCLENGVGLARDEARAAELYRLASTAIPDALNRLIVMQIEGRGIPRDAAKAHALVEQQIAQGKAADMLYLGVRLLNQDDIADAESVFQRARSGPASPASRESIEFAEALTRAGKAYRVKLRLAPAESLLDDAVALLERLPDATTPGALAEALDELAIVYEQSGRARLAEPLLQRGLNVRIKAYGQRHDQVAQGYGMLAWLYTSLDRYDAAERFRRMSLALKQEIFGLDAPETDKARSSLAQLLYLEGKYQEAEPLFLQLLASAEARLGKDHSALAIPLNNVAYNYLELGRYDLAEDAIRRANAIHDRESNGKPSHFTATGLNSLGVVLLGTGRYAEAEDALLKSLGMREELLGRDHPDVSISLANLGKLYIATGRFTQADAVLERAMKIVAPDAAETWEVAGILYEQGRSQQKQGKAAQGVETLRNALAIRLRILPKHPSTKETAVALASLYRSMGDEAAASEVETGIASAAEKKDEAAATLPPTQSGSDRQGLNGKASRS